MRIRETCLPTFLMMIVMASTIFINAGCQSTGPRPKGVPADAYIVASGNRIEFDAPGEGYLYLVSEGEIIAQRRLHKGQQFTAIGDASPSTEGPLSKFDHATAYFQPANFKTP